MKTWSNTMVVVEYWRRLMRFLDTYDGPAEKRQALLVEAELVRTWCIQAMAERKTATGGSGRDYLIRKELYRSTPRPETKPKLPNVVTVSKWTPEHNAVLKKFRRQNRA